MPMNPFLPFVKTIQAGVNDARNLSVTGHRPPPESGPTVLIFSPHPDDECVIGLLPLRLMREQGMRIVNIPVTFGSKKERQAERARELRDACGYLGWESHTEQQGTGALEVEEAVRVLEKFQPEIIFFPHEKDWNSRHVSTHRLVVDALKRMGPGFMCQVVETEFWGAMEDPNLMVEGDAETVADLVAATSLHKGEVARNPYHVLLPAWMQDNVRRGGELVGGQGRSAPDMSFATLYRLRKWEKGEWQDIVDTGTFVTAHGSVLGEIF